MPYCELAGGDERCERVSLFTHREILNGSGLPHASRGQSDSQSWSRGAGGGEEGRSKGWEKRDFVHSAPKTFEFYVHIDHVMHYE